MRFVVWNKVLACGSGRVWHPTSASLERLMRLYRHTPTGHRGQYAPDHASWVEWPARHRRLA